MGRLIPLFALADLAILVIALIDCLSVDEYAIRALPRVAWVFIILLFSPVGGIAWFVAGRPQHDPVRRQHWRPGNGFPEAERPRRDLAPDDDPEFLRRLAARAQREDTERLRAWEADLRRREEELRRQERERRDEDRRRGEDPSMD
jgi:hypothetical protein